MSHPDRTHTGPLPLNPFRVPYEPKPIRLKTPAESPFLAYVDAVAEASRELPLWMFTLIGPMAREDGGGIVYEQTISTADSQQASNLPMLRL